LSPAVIPTSDRPLPVEERWDFGLGLRAGVHSRSSVRNHRGNAHQSGRRACCWSGL